MASALRKFIRASILLSNKLHVAIILIAYFSCVCCQLTIAQVCNDSSGELVINQTFGDSGNNPLAAGLTSYEYEPINCPGDGQYTIISTLDGTCFNSTWYAVATNHTPNDAKGNMMVVNGGSKPGAFYEQPVSSLCKGTTYEISVWIINLLKTGTCSNPLIPNLSINVETTDGLVIQSVTIGQISQTDIPIWRRYAAVFTVPTTTEDVVIKLINNQGDYGCGNDLVIDDFQVRQCGACADVPDLIYVPDAFTPNNDGVNDTLAIFLRSSAASSFSLKVYNRWGSLIFTSTDPTHKWDGTYAGSPCLSGTYTWIIVYNPGTQTKADYVQTGKVLLVR